MAYRGQSLLTNSMMPVSSYWHISYLHDQRRAFGVLQRSAGRFSNLTRWTHLSTPTSLSPLIPSPTTCHGDPGISTLFNVGHDFFQASKNHNSSGLEPSLQALARVLNPVSKGSTHTDKLSLNQCYSLLLIQHHHDLLPGTGS